MENKIKIIESMINNDFIELASGRYVESYRNYLQGHASALIGAYGILTDSYLDYTEKLYEVVNMAFERKL